MKNRQKTLYRVFLVLTLVFSTTTVYFMYAFDALGDIAGAGFMVSLLLALTFFICIFIFRKRSRVVEYALNKGSFIARWQYSEQEWEDYLRQEYGYRKERNKGIFIFLSIITVVIFMFFVLFVEEAKLAMFLVMLGLVAMYGLVAFIIPFLIYHFHKQHTAEVMIMEKSILIDKQFHTWDFPLSKFSSADVDTVPYPHISVVYEFIDRTGPRSYTVNIPVPEGENAHGVVEQLKKANKKK